MKERVMVIAPHPDDETLGAGGTLLRMKAERRISGRHSPGSISGGAIVKGYVRSTQV